MADYKVVISASAEKAFRKIPVEYARRLSNAILDLGRDPHPLGCRKLAGEEALYRIRVGAYRVIYEIHNRELLILVLKIGNRKDVYR